MSADLAAIVARLEAVAAKLEGASGGGGGGAAAGADDDFEAPEWLADFDALIAGDLAAFLTLCGSCGDKAAAAAVPLVTKCFALTRDLLSIVGQSKKPAGFPGAMPDNIMAMVQEIGGMMGELGNLRGSREVEKALGEGAQSFSWVIQEAPNLPGKHAQGMSEAMWFWGQKVVVQNKGKDQGLVDWANSFKKLLATLVAYIKASHKTGLSWNPRGGDAGGAKGGAAPAAAPAPAAGGAPPPPPGPAPVLEKVAVPEGAGRAGLFAALNRGGDVTKGLNKVEKQKAATGAVKAKVKKSKVTKKMGDPKAALEGRKWAVEFQVDNKEIVIEGANTKQAVNIYRCIGSVIVIKDKVNCILLDDCDKCAVVCMQGCVASIDVVNCKSAEVQIDQSAPTLMVDKTDGCQIYLSNDSKNLNIITSKSSEVNVSVPGPDEDSDPVENALPEQFQSIYTDGKGWDTQAIRHE